MARNNFFINLNLVSNNLTDFENCKKQFDNQIFSALKNSYINSCTDSGIQSIANALNNYYSNILKDYQNIFDWWSEYLKNTKGLENYLSGKGSIGEITISSLKNFVSSKLEPIQKYENPYFNVFPNIDKNSNSNKNSWDPILGIGNSSNTINNSSSKLFKFNLNQVGLKKYSNTGNSSSSIGNTSAGNFSNSFKSDLSNYSNVGNSSSKMNQNGNFNHLDSNIYVEQINNIANSSYMNKPIDSAIYNVSSKQMGNSSTDPLGLSNYVLNMLEINTIRKNVGNSVSKEEEVNINLTDFLTLDENTRGKLLFFYGVSVKNDVTKGHTVISEEGYNKMPSSAQEQFKKQGGIVKRTVSQREFDSYDSKSKMLFLAVGGTILGHGNDTTMHATDYSNMTESEQYLYLSLGGKVIGDTLPDEYMPKIDDKSIESLKNQIKNFSYTLHNGTVVVTIDNVDYNISDIPEPIVSYLCFTNGEFLNYLSNYNNSIKTYYDAHNMGDGYKDSNDYKLIEEVLVKLASLGKSSNTSSLLTEKEFLTMYQIFKNDGTYYSINYFNITVPEERIKALGLEENVDTSDIVNLTDMFSSLSFNQFSANASYNANVKWYNNLGNDYDNIKQLAQQIEKDCGTEEAQQIVDSLLTTTDEYGLVFKKNLDEMKKIAKICSSNKIEDENIKKYYINKIEALAEANEQIKNELLAQKKQVEAKLYELEVQNIKLDMNQFKDIVFDYNQCLVTINGKNYSYEDVPSIAYAYLALHDSELSQKLADELENVSDEVASTIEYQNFRDSLYFNVGNNSGSSYKGSLNYMTEEQLNTYMVIWQKYGIEQANEYYASIENSLNALKGYDDAVEYLENLGPLDANTFTRCLKDLTLFGQGEIDGIETFFRGLGNINETKGKYSTDEWKQMYIVQLLSNQYQASSEEEQQRLNNLTDKSSAFWYNIGQANGNMLPSMLASVGVTAATGGLGAPVAITELAGSITSTGMIFASSYGNTKNQLLCDGKSLEEAQKRALTSSAVEAISEFALGSIEGIGLSKIIPNSKVAAETVKESSKLKNYLIKNIKIAGDLTKDALQEGVQEGTQEFISSMANTVLFGDYTNSEDLKTSVIESAKAGAVSAVFLNAEGKVAGNVLGINKMQPNNESNLNQEINDAITENSQNTNNQNLNATNISQIVNQNSSEINNSIKENLETVETVNNNVVESVNNIDITADTSNTINSINDVNIKEVNEVQNMETNIEVLDEVSDINTTGNLETAVQEINNSFEQNVIKLKESLKKLAKSTLNFSLGFGGMITTAVGLSLALDFNPIFILGSLGFVVTYNSVYKPTKNSLFTTRAGATLSNFGKQMIEMTKPIPLIGSGKFVQDILSGYSSKKSLTAASNALSVMLANTFLQLEKTGITGKPIVYSGQTHEVVINMLNQMAEEGFIIPVNKNTNIEAPTTVDVDGKTYNVNVKAVNSGLATIAKKWFGLGNYKVYDLKNEQKMIGNNNKDSKKLIYDFNFVLGDRKFTVEDALNFVNRPRLNKKTGLMEATNNKEGFIEIKTRKDGTQYLGLNEEILEINQKMRKLEKVLEKNPNDVEAKTELENLSKELKNYHNKQTIENIKSNNGGTINSAIDSDIEILEEIDNNTKSILDSNSEILNNNEIKWLEKLKSINPDFVHFEEALSFIDDFFLNLNRTQDCGYGANQGILKVKFNSKNRMYYKERIKTLKKYIRKQLPGIKTHTLNYFLASLDSSKMSGGVCSFVPEVNAIINYFCDNQQLFKEKFGYDLFYDRIGTKTGNKYFEVSQDLLLADLFVFVTKKNYNAYGIEENLYKENGNWNYRDNGNGSDAVYQVFRAYAESVEVGESIDCIPLIAYFKSKGIDLSAKIKPLFKPIFSQKDKVNVETLTSNIKEKLNENQTLYIGVGKGKNDGVYLYNNPSDIKDNDNIFTWTGKSEFSDNKLNGHAMTITGVTDNGMLIVDTWGMKKYISLQEFIDNNGGNISSIEISEKVENLQLQEFYLENDIYLNENLLVNEMLKINENCDYETLKQAVELSRSNLLYDNRIVEFYKTHNRLLTQEEINYFKTINNLISNNSLKSKLFRQYNQNCQILSNEILAKIEKVYSLNDYSLQEYIWKDDNCIKFDDIAWEIIYNVPGESSSDTIIRLLDNPNISNEKVLDLINLCKQDKELSDNYLKSLDKDYSYDKIIDDLKFLLDVKNSGSLSIDSLKSIVKDYYGSSYQKPLQEQITKQIKFDSKLENRNTKGYKLLYDKFNYDYLNLDNISKEDFTKLCDIIDSKISSNSNYEQLISTYLSNKIKLTDVNIQDAINFIETVMTVPENFNDNMQTSLIKLFKYNNLPYNDMIKIINDFYAVNTGQGPQVMEMVFIKFMYHSNNFEIDEQQIKTWTDELKNICVNQIPKYSVANYQVNSILNKYYDTKNYTPDMFYDWCNELGIKPKEENIQATLNQDLESSYNNSELQNKINRLQELEQIRNNNPDIIDYELEKEYFKLKNYIELQQTTEINFLSNELDRLTELQKNDSNNTLLNNRIEKIKEIIIDINNKKEKIFKNEDLTVYELAKLDITDAEVPNNLLDMASKHATEILEKVKEKEKQITNDMLTLETDLSCLIGEAFKIKEHDSLTRKIISDAAKTTGKDIENLTISDIEEAASKIGDGLRYTLLIDDASYKTILDKSLTDLTEKGYEVINFKNYWGGKYYQGINVSIKSPTGLLFELQFHTPYSFLTKENLTHDFYQVKRNDSINEDTQELADELQKAYQSLVETPNGVSEYNWKIENKKLLNLAEFYDGTEMPLSEIPDLRKVQEKMLNNEPLTIGDKIKLRDHVEKNIGGYELKHNYAYRVVTESDYNEYIRRGYISSVVGDEYTSSIGNLGIDWYLGGACLKYGNREDIQVIIECPAYKNFFTPAHDNGNGMTDDVIVRHVKSSGYDNPIPMTMITNVIKRNVKTGEITFDNINAT